METENKAIIAVEGQSGPEMNDRTETGVKKQGGPCESLPLKVVSFILLIALGLAAIASTIGVGYLGANGAYFGEGGFYSSSWCRNLAYQEFWNKTSVFDMNRAGSVQTLREAIKNPSHPLHPDNTNVLFVMKQYDPASGAYRVVAQSCDGEVVGAHYQTEQYYSDFEGYDVYFQVDLYIRSPLTVNDEFMEAKQAYDFLFSHRHTLIWIMVASLVMAIVLFVFMLRAAGHKKGETGITPNFVDRIPLDLLLAGVISLITAILYTGYEIERNWGLLFAATIVCLTVGAAACGALTLGVFLSFSTRVKLGKFWENTLVFRVRRLISRHFRRAMGFCYKIVGYLPFTWKSVGVLAVVAFCNMFFGAIAGSGEEAGLVFLFLFNVAFAVGIVLFTMNIRHLEDAARRIADGDLEYKVDTSKMRWNVREHGESLNRIGEGMQKAVAERMKSERLKTELITNVSHDIKTPLTSIINYIDIMKKEGGDPEKTQEYLEILTRQSARLKKLTDDLVEASKASAGAIAMNSENMDVSELLRQAVGEYDERLATAGVEPVVNSASGAIIFADGTLMWRVFDNLLSNIARYAQSSTRAYFAVEKSGESIIITFRNISRDVLNVSADELMERFVRGDSSRTDGGSGLGLAIARSLTELMGGEFSILLDGDLFKVTIRFRAVG